MNPVNIAIVISLLIFGIIMLGVLAYFIYRPARELVLRSKSNNVLTKKVSLVQKVDDMLDQDNPFLAIPLLSSILYLEVPRSAENLAGIREINQLFLSRTLSVAERIGARVPNIEVLEALVTERSELLHLMFKARYSYETILGKREDHGKTIPKWTKDEFRRKESEIDSALKSNLTSLQNELEKVTLALKQGSSGEYLIH